MTESQAYERQVGPDDLERLNRWPIGMLAGVAMAAGADSAAAIARAQRLLDEHGTSRAIDAAHTAQLIQAMREWPPQTGDDRLTPV